MSMPCLSIWVLRPNGHSTCEFSKARCSDAENEAPESSDLGPHLVRYRTGMQTLADRRQQVWYSRRKGTSHRCRPLNAPRQEAQAKCRGLDPNLLVSLTGT